MGKLFTQFSLNFNKYYSSANRLNESRRYHLKAEGVIFNEKSFFLAFIVKH